MDTSLLEILVCPICKGALKYDKKSNELICNLDKLAYPINNGIPIMWPDKARNLIKIPD